MARQRRNAQCFNGLDLWIWSWQAMWMLSFLALEEWSGNGLRNEKNSYLVMTWRGSRTQSVLIALTSFWLLFCVVQTTTLEAHTELVSRSRKLWRDVGIIPNSWTLFSKGTGRRSTWRNCGTFWHTSYSKSAQVMLGNRTETQNCTLVFLIWRSWIVLFIQSLIFSRKNM